MGKRTIRKKRNSLRIKRSKNKKRSKTKILSKYSRKKLKKTKMRKRYGGTPRIVESEHPKPITKENIKGWLKNKKRGIFSGKRTLSCIPPNYSSKEIRKFLNRIKIDPNNYVMDLKDSNRITMYNLKITPEVYRVLIAAKYNNYEVTPQTAEDTINYRFSDFINLKSHADPRFSTPALSLQRADNCYDRIMSINKLLSEISIAFAPLFSPSQSVTSEMCLELDKNYSGHWQGFTSLFKKAFNCGVSFDKIREQERIIEEQDIQGELSRLSLERREEFEKYFPKEKFGLSSPRKRELFYRAFWLLFKGKEGGMEIIKSIVENLKRYIRENNTESYELRSSRLTVGEGTQKSPEPATGESSVESPRILRENPEQTEEELSAPLSAPLEFEGAWNPEINFQTEGYRRRRKSVQEKWEETMADQQEKASVNPDSSDRGKLDFDQNELIDYNHPNIRTISDFVGPGDLKANGEECISENECMSLSCKGGVCTSGDEES